MFNSRKNATSLRVAVIEFFKKKKKERKYNLSIYQSYEKIMISPIKNFKSF